MPIPLLGLLLRGAMGAAAGTTRLAAMSGGAGRGMIGNMTRGALARRALRPRDQDVPRMDTPEMQVLRQRIKSPLVTGEQRQGDRGKLATMLLSQRRERNNDRSKNQEIDKTARSFSVLSLRTASFALAAGGATAGLSKLAQATNDSVIQQRKIFSPRLAAVASKQEVFNIKMNTRLANATSPSVERIAGRTMNIQEGLLPFKVASENIQNTLKEIPLVIIEGIVEILDDVGIADLVKWVNKWFADDKSKERGHLLETLEQIRTKGLHNDPNLMNRRPNEKPGGRM